MARPALPQEHLLRLDLNGEKSIMLICSNADLPELLLGYLKNEGLIRCREQVAELTIAPDGHSASVRLAVAQALPQSEVRSSGLGGTLLQSDCSLAPRPLGRRFSRETIRRGGALLQERAVQYAATGGMHASALFDGQHLLAFYEDIGRHNTLDKLAGACMLRCLDSSDTLLITTGRITSDMVRKGAALGTSVIASMSTPTDLAYEAAVGANLTLIGYLRREPMHIYCGEKRITD